MHLHLIFRNARLRNVLLFIFLFASFSGAAQTFTLSVREERLERVFLQIEKLSAYSFIYTEELIAQASPVTFTVKNATLETVLELCFRNQPVEFVIEEKHIIVRKRAIQKPVTQGRELTGRVVNEKGEPVPGVSVTASPEEILVVTDGNGHFHFANLPKTAKIQVSGAEIESQEVYPGNTSFLLITVQTKQNVLDETFVIAYGRATKRNSTGTVSSVKKKDIDNQPVSNLLSVLSGRVPGLEVTQVSGAPGTDFRVRLRGINSIANGNDPLVVIDGVPYPSAPLSGIIGGGGGTSISAFNLINPSDVESIEVLRDADATAIYGSRGANGVILITTTKGKVGKTSVSVGGYHGFGHVTRKMKLLNTQEYLAMRREAFNNDGTNPTTANAPDLLVWDTTRQTDWQEELLGHTMYSTDLNLNLTGGSENTQFVFGGAYHKETTVFPGEFGENRKTSRLALNHLSSNRRFSISISTSYSVYNNTLPQQDLVSAITLPPNAPRIYNDDGTLNWENNTWTNPFSRLESTFTYKTTSVITNLNASYRLFPGVFIRVSGGFNQVDEKDNSKTPKTSFNPISSNSASARFGSKTIRTLIAEPQIEYSSTFKNTHCSLLFGSTLQNSTQDYLYQRGTGYNSDELLNSLQAASQITVLSEGNIQYKYFGLFSRLKFEIKKRYLLTATIRRDGSSRFGDENKFSNFGSLGAGWIFSNTELAKKLKYLSYGKLKGSVGITGNDQISDYGYLDLFSTYSYNYLNSPVFYPAQLYNPLFGWEKVRKVEGSLELGFWKNRVISTINYYNNTTTNQLVSYPLPLTTGFGSIVANIPAKIRNTGLEIEIQGRIIQQKKLKWLSTFNITIPHNKLISFEEFEQSSYASFYEIGQPLTIAKRLLWLGVDPQTGNHQFEDFDKDGRILQGADSKHVIFTGQKYFGGMQHTINAGRWEFNVLFQFANVPHASNYLYVFSRPGLVMNQPEWVMSRWRNPGDITDVQRFSSTNSVSSTAFSNYRQSSAAYSNASFIRLKNVAISYSLLALGKTHPVISDCRLFLKGNNLLTFSRYTGMDPETLTYLMPPIRLFTGGFQITFK